MSIYEYDEEKELQLIREDERAAGEYRKLITLICKKLKKGLQVAEIAEMLEENEDTVQKVCAAATEFAPEYDAEMIWKKLTNIQE